MVKRINVPERVYNCIINCGIEGQNLYSKLLVTSVQERLETDAFLIAEHDGFRLNPADYWNYSKAHLIKTLTRTAININDKRFSFHSGVIYSFINNCFDSNYTKHLNPSKDDGKLALQIIEESDKVYFRD